MAHSEWPQWRYGPNGEGAVFASEADVPRGWHDHPSKHEKEASPPPAKTPAKTPAKAPAKKAGRPAKAKAPAAKPPLDL